MNIFADFEARIAAVLEDIAASGRLPRQLDLRRFVVEPPRDPSHGDLACNAAMVFAREAKAHFANPRQLATEIAMALAVDPQVAEAEVAGPGFINVRLQPEVFLAVLQEMLHAGGDFGRGAQKGEPVNVEYVSANPTGPMHVGHGRGAVFGDALANLLAFAGHPVTREYYINDAGAQIGKLARSAYLRYREANGETVAADDLPYPGDYLKGVGEELARARGRGLMDAPEKTWLPVARDTAIDAMMATIRGDLRAINIRHEVFFSERSLIARRGSSDAVNDAIEELRAKGLVYEGRLPPPKGQPDQDWEDREQLLFKSTAFGDDVDRPLMKSDGAYTYFATDIAYHKSKLERGFRTMIDVWGADHGGYRKRMLAAVSALSGGAAVLDVKLCQLVNLLRDGAVVKMSKRAGDFVTLREVVDEVGVDAVRFMMLFRKNDAPLDFDLAKVIEKSKDNPVFYVQYGHARGRSALREGAKAFADLDLSAAALATAPLGRLEDHGEQDLIRLMAQFPRLVEAASAAHEPHRIAFYLYDLASHFHVQWNRGKDHRHLRFVNENDRELTCARLALVTAFTCLVQSGLAILGVTAPEEMR